MLDAIAWPAVGLILGLVAIFTFRSAIVNKIDRLSRAGKDGVQFERAQDATPPPNEALSFEDFMRQPISATVLERERAWSAEFAKLNFKSDAERISLLHRAVATTAVELEFTRIAHTIFGSQTNLLVQLAGRRQGLDRQEVERIYLGAKNGFPALYEERPIESWFGYLQNSGLVTIQDNKIDITQQGSDFLKFLVDARLAYDRHG